MFIKRDDFTGSSLFGGNKIRKLEYLLGEAEATECDSVFTFGATQSNHAMQTAWACCKRGLKPVLYLTAIVKPDENDVRASLLLDRILGAEVHIIEQLDGETEAQAEARGMAMAREQMASLEAEGHHCYEIPMGGARDTGTIGFVEGYLELQMQLAEMGISADYIFHASGTGGTMAGLQAGRKLINSQETIVSVSVCERDESFLTDRTELTNRVLHHIDGKAAMVDKTEDIHLDLNYYQPGYEQPNEKASEAIRMLAQKEGLFLDPVYTGKGFAGLVDYIRSGKVSPSSNVIFWHTGGATALFAEREVLGDELLK